MCVFIVKYNIIVANSNVNLIILIIAARLNVRACTAEVFYLINRIYGRRFDFTGLCNVQCTVT